MESPADFLKWICGDFFRCIVSISAHEKFFQNHLVKSFHFNYNPSDT